MGTGARRVAHLNEIDFIETIIASRFLNVENGNDVFVIEVAQKFHLSQSSQAEHGVIERCDLLDCHLLAGRLMYRGAGSRHYV